MNDNVLLSTALSLSLSSRSLGYRISPHTSNPPKLVAFNQTLRLQSVNTVFIGSAVTMADHRSPQTRLGKKSESGFNMRGGDLAEQQGWLDPWPSV